MSWLVRWCRRGSAPCGTSRRILSLLVTRDLKVKYADSVLGYLWSILEPLAMAGVYWFVFTKLMTRQLGEDPYIVFLLCGMLPWQWTNAALRSSMKALSKDSKLVRSTNLPREIWVLRTVGSKFAEFVYAIPVLAFFALITHAELTLVGRLRARSRCCSRRSCSPAPGCMLAPLAVLYGDVERLMRIVHAAALLLLADHLRPARRDVGSPRPRACSRKLYILNPLAGIFDLYRTAFFPDQWVRLGRRRRGGGHLGGHAGRSGIRVFRRLEGTVLKEI